MFYGILSLRGGCAVLSALLIMLASTHLFNVARAETISGLQRVEPQPKAAEIRPGLRVEYLSAFVRHVDICEASGKGIPGKALEALDWNTGDGEVLTSGEEDGVCARISGLMNFPKPGRYILATQSNDGVRLLVGKKQIIDDPDVHSDQFSAYVNVDIEKSGWYPLYLIYFERRGTSTLELYWQPPGAQDFDLVPAGAFAHRK